MIVTVSFNATPNKRDELVAKLQEILADTRAFDGCNSVIFAEGTDSPGELILIEDWDDLASYEAYKAWRQNSGTSVLSTDLVDKSSLSSSSFNPI